MVVRIRRQNAFGGVSLGDGEEYAGRTFTKDFSSVVGNGVLDPYFDDANEIFIWVIKSDVINLGMFSIRLGEILEKFLFVMNEIQSESVSIIRPSLGEYFDKDSRYRDFYDLKRCTISGDSLDAHQLRSRL